MAAPGLGAQTERSPGSLARLALFDVAVLVAQIGLLPYLAPAGTIIQIAALPVYFAGALMGYEVGAVSGFLVGLALDGRGDALFGLHALLYGLLGFGAAALHSREKPSPGILGIASALSQAGVCVMELAFAALLGRDAGLGVRLLQAAVFSGAVSVLIGVPAARLFVRFVKPVRVEQSRA